VDAVRAFLLEYGETFVAYEACALAVRQALRKALRDEGVRAIVTSRAKSQERLEAKLRARERSRGAPYGSPADVMADVHDLVGARIAVYFPGSQARVNRLIEERFEAASPKRVFPIEAERAGPARATHDGGAYRPRFSGYSATHHRLLVPASSLPAEAARAVPEGGLEVEVQVASVLMHAWAEVEHDLVYKPVSGPLSLDEHAVLDELNGLVLAGELALERLERAEAARTATQTLPFEDAFALAAFLAVRGADGEGLGKTDVLFALLRRFERATPAAVADLVARDRASRSPMAAPLADRLAALFVEGDPERAEALRAIAGGWAVFDLAEAGTRELGAFFEAGRTVDRIVGELLGGIGEWGKRLVVSDRGAELLAIRGELTSEEASELVRLRRARDRILGQEPGLLPSDVARTTEALEAWVARLAERRRAPPP
jgi:ppGpp synthetase/RelA/SpoT-type nucleotidyltranferase